MPQVRRGFSGSTPKVLIVGGGPAADGAAVGLREGGFRGSITMVSEEWWSPYERPHLSKGFLTGQVPAEKLPLRPPAQYELYGVEMKLGQQVAEVDIARHSARLRDGATLEFDLLLLATGRAPRRLEVPGALYLRTREEAERIRRALDGPSLHVLGAGFIGCEVAASARSLGVSVVLQEALPAPMQRVLGPRLGGWLAGVHREHGVDLRLGEAGVPAERPLLVAAGTEPRDELGLPLTVDEFGRTEIEGVFAAGDCASYFSPIYGRHVRVEHFQTAGRHGTAVGKAMAGVLEPFAEAPWFWSDQYDLNLQYAGAGVEWDQEVVRGEFGEPPFSVFQLAGGELVGALGVNDARTISRTRRLLQARAPVTAAQLEDRAFDLRPERS
ncbi:MAG TPA: FAD-dependent oxidoreductase [Candidatus Dormibacteraeota bacterium]